MTASEGLGFRLPLSADGRPAVTVTKKKLPR
jgi:hypothetical protein